MKNLYSLPFIFLSLLAIKAESQIDISSMLKAGSVTATVNTPFDVGSISDVFDNNTSTLVRTPQVNPLVITLSFTNKQALVFSQLWFATVGKWTMEAANNLNDLNTKTISYKLLFNNVTFSDNEWSNVNFDSVNVFLVRLTAYRTSGDNYVHLNEWKLYESVEVDSVKILPDTLSVIEKGMPNDLDLYGLVGKGSSLLIPDDSLSWFSSDPSIATVNAKGVVMGLAKGMVQINAVYKNFKDSLVLEVIQLFDSTSLPIVIIDTKGQNIPDEPKIIAEMGIINNGIGKMNHINDPHNSYKGKIAIEVRGSSSQSFPKLSYGFETRTALGSKQDASLLGMPEEHDWILSASYTDKTHLRNVLSYKLYNDFGRYAPRTRYCELVINGEYKGVYILMEKIKRDSSRVSIAKLHSWENAGDSLTGGYIIKIDKSTGNGGSGWTSKYAPAVNNGGKSIYFQYEYPDPDSITFQQKKYIQQYVDSFETSLKSPGFSDSLNGYAKYCKVNTFIDYFILNEISRNIDGYRLSTYLYKDKLSDGGKIGIGPPWDYDIAWLNADYCTSPIYTGWAYKFGDDCPDDYWQVPFWWERLMQDKNFTTNLKCRWTGLRKTVLSTSYIHSYIDSTASYLSEGINRNFKHWPILGTYVWPNPAPIPTTYQGEIDRLKQWISNRMSWLDSNMPGTCIFPSIPEKCLDKDIFVFPNPSSGIFNIQCSWLMVDKVEIFDVMGREIQHVVSGNGIQSIDISGSADGIYMFKIYCGEQFIIRKIMKSDGE